jgi:hypothetical protein
MTDPEEILRSRKDIPEATNDSGAAGRPGVDDGRQREFHIEEFKALRAEIAAGVSRSVAILQYVLLISAILYSFLIGFNRAEIAATPIRQLAFFIVWSIPSACSILGAIVCYGAATYIRTIGGYLATLENRIGYSELGWERHFSESQKKYALGQFAASGIAWVLGAYHYTECDMCLCGN